MEFEGMRYTQESSVKQQTILCKTFRHFFLLCAASVHHLKLSRFLSKVSCKSLVSDTNRWHIFHDKKEWDYWDHVFAEMSFSFKSSKSISIIQKTRRRHAVLVDSFQRNRHWVRRKFTSRSSQSYSSHLVSLKLFTTSNTTSSSPRLPELAADTQRPFAGAKCIYPSAKKVSEMLFFQQTWMTLSCNISSKYV